MRLNALWIGAVMSRSKGAGTPVLGSETPPRLSGAASAPWMSPPSLLKLKPSAFSVPADTAAKRTRSEEHTSELQSLMRISYAVFCLKKKNTKKHQTEMKCNHITHMNNLK